MNYNPLSLKSKVILVVGASSGIGRATAIEASKAGAILILVGRNENRLQEVIEELDGDNNKYIVADITTPVGVESILASLTTIDGLVLSAGKGLTLPVQFATREKFDDIFNVNLFSQVELLRVIYKKKLISKGSSIVVISSLGGLKVFSGSNSIYGASKAALSSFVKYCAKEFSPRKIRVNAICPGMVNTPLIHRGTLSEEQLNADMERYPLKRYGEPIDIAHSALFLLSDASSWITGIDLIVDGGLSIS
ncbi:MAG: SDR family oxidoreductase [Rikenellaceae bacterium]